MKKFIYILFAAAIGFLYIGCSEADNLGADGDTTPGVVIYSYSLPAGADPDLSENLRATGNSLCTKIYILAEPKEDKDAFIQNNGEAAYAQRVINMGDSKVLDDTTRCFDYLNTNMPGSYAVTAVGVDASGQPSSTSEFLHNGATYELLGNAIYSNNTFNPITNQPTPWYRSTNLATPVYKMEYYPGFFMKFNWDATGKLSFTFTGTASSGQLSPLSSDYWRLTTPFVNATYGAYYMEVGLAVESSYYSAADNTVYMTTRRAVAPGSFAGFYSIIIKLP